jgi:hypothetical protein
MTLSDRQTPGFKAPGRVWRPILRQLLLPTVHQRPGANMSAFEQPARYRDTPGALDPYVSPDATTPPGILVIVPTALHGPRNELIALASEPEPDDCNAPDCVAVLS